MNTDSRPFLQLNNFTSRPFLYLDYFTSRPFLHLDRFTVQPNTALISHYNIIESGSEFFLQVSELVIKLKLGTGTGGDFRESPTR